MIKLRGREAFYPLVGRSKNAMHPIVVEKAIMNAIMPFQSFRQFGTRGLGEYTYAVDDLEAFIAYVLNVNPPAAVSITADSVVLLEADSPRSRSDNRNSNSGFAFPDLDL